MYFLGCKHAQYKVHTGPPKRKINVNTKPTARLLNSKSVQIFLENAKPQRCHLSSWSKNPIGKWTKSCIKQRHYLGHFARISSSDCTNGLRGNSVVEHFEQLIIQKFTQKCFWENFCIFFNQLLKNCLKDVLSEIILKKKENTFFSSSPQNPKTKRRSL